MFVSRKNLSLIHFFPAEMAARVDILQAHHQGIESLDVSRALGELREPFTERIVDGSALLACDEARALDQVLVGAEGNVLHTRIVCTILVYAAALPMGFLGRLFFLAARSIR